MFSNFKNTVKQHVRNIPGWRTKRKIVVFESDDWGAIRMPSKNTYNKLFTKGLKVDANPYNRNDCLESNQDLEALFETLTKYKDKNNKHPVFTALAIVANPDFDKIKENNFTTYEYETVLTTLSKYGSSHDKVYELWKEGISSEIFVPEFHGREHLNIKRWMDSLKNETSVSRVCFDHYFYGLGPEEANEIRPNHFPAFDLDTIDDLENQKKIVIDGIKLFKKIVGYDPNFFVPPNFLSNHLLEEYMADFNINLLTGSRNHIEPTGENEYKRSIRYTGKKNKYNQTYIVRNSQFEYAQSKRINEWQLTLKDIETSFLWNKPAIISTHRLNYSGHINEKNRKEGLYQLDLLLKNIVMKWPEVEFMSTKQLGDLIKGNEE